MFYGGQRLITTLLTQLQVVREVQFPMCLKEEENQISVYDGNVWQYLVYFTSPHKGRPSIYSFSFIRKQDMKKK